MNKKKLYLFSFFVFAQSLLYASPTVTLEAPQLSTNEQNHLIVTAGKPFQITVTISQGDRNTGLQEIIGIDNVQIIGKSQTSELHMTNGTFSSHTTYIYEVLPKVSGSFTLGPATIKKNNQEISSNILTFQTTSESPNQPSPPAQQQSRSLGSQQQRSQQSPQEPVVICELETSNATPYVSEPFEVTLNIYSIGNILQDGIAPTQFQGFWVQEVKKVTSSLVERDGKQYERKQKKFILTPKQAGTSTINPIQYIYAAEVQRQRPRTLGFAAEDFFSDFFNGGRIKESETTSNNLTITAQELPHTTQPVDGVGVFDDYTATLNKNEVSVNDPITLTLRISGKANFDQLAEPRLKLPQGIKFYKSKVDVQQDLTHGYQEGTKIFEFILQPSKHGEITIQAQNFTFFDTHIKRYRTISTKPLTLSVHPREHEANLQVSSHEEQSDQTQTPQSTSDRPQHDIAFIEEEGSATQRESSEIPWYIVLFFLFFPFIIWGKPHVHRSMKKIIPHSLAKKHAHQKLLKQFNEEFKAIIAEKQIGKLYNFFIAYLGYKHAVDEAIVTEQWITQQLHTCGWKSEKITAFIEFLNACASLHFSSSPEGHDIDQLIKQARYWLVVLSQ